MGERLTDEQLRGLAQLEGNGDAGAMRSVARELLTLRARVAELETENARINYRTISDARSECIQDMRKFLADGLREMGVDVGKHISLTEVLTMIRELREDNDNG